MAKNGTYHDKTASTKAEVDSVGLIDVRTESVATTKKPAAQMKSNKEALTRSAICRRTSDDAATATRNGAIRANVARRRAEIQGRPENWIV